MRFTIDHLMAKGFVPFSRTNVVNNDAMTGTGHSGAEESAYKMERDDLNLIEHLVSVTSYHRDEILTEEN
jgi:seryl-tRNA synthetase